METIILKYIEGFIRGTIACMCIYIIYFFGKKLAIRHKKIEEAKFTVLRDEAIRRKKRLEEERMMINEARLIREVKKSCTWRKLAEIYYPKEDPNHGMQYGGIDLCREALTVLYPDHEVWMMDFPEERFGDSFKTENKSYIGDFYWWE